jgi:hypothetical protein
MSYFNFAAYTTSIEFIFMSADYEIGYEDCYENIC